MSASETSRTHVRLTRRQGLKLTAGTAAAALLSARYTGVLRAAQATPGGRLVIGKPYEVTGTDPHPEANQTSWELLACCYESLLALDDAMQPIPHLAESWEQTDPTTFVFNLRAGVTFHNGREMTADDVVFSLNRLLDPATASFWATKMGPPIPPPAVGEGTPTPPPGIGLTVEATGPLQITARLSEPYAPFLSTMAGINAAIVPGQEVEDGSLDLSTTIVGTGPFKVLEHAEDQRWVLGRHDGYWQPDRPYADELIWQVMPDEASRVASLRSGEIQIATFENPKMLDLLAGDAAVTTVQQVTTNYYILFVNAQHPELADQRVRQAISVGIDREQIRDLALFGRGTVTGPIAAGFGALASPLDQVPFYTHDPEQAKALLAEAGVSNLKLSLLVTPALASTIPMAEVIKAQLA